MSDRELLDAAIAARSGSYSPYSRFPVGAVLRDRDGKLWSGANVENASYGLGMCAERTAVFNAVAQGARGFDVVAVSGPDGTTTLPCGACRQVLWEFGPGMAVVYADAGEPKRIALRDLLPHAFGPDDLSGR
ncbi:MAG TPA: cytidine deaminase [Candidatus Elarobacter sp.]